jgi:prophage regulatory protein
MPKRNQTPPPPERVSRLRAVIDRTGLSKNSIARLVKIGEFPAPIWLSANCRGYLDSEISAWIASRPKSQHAEVPSEK